MSETTPFESSALGWPREMKGSSMRKSKPEAVPDMLTEYDFSQGVRGKHVKRFNAGANIVVLTPDVARAFPDSESVNEALKLLMRIAERKTGKGHRARI
ncbi:MAG: hypothetical protein ACT4QC_09010 [Planctomycetaceae bacterium]